jgi:hypothetical protein
LSIRDTDILYAALNHRNLLIGRIRDDRGHAMTSTHAQKGSRRYRYYVSQAVLQGRARAAITRVPAHDIEVLVLNAIRKDRIEIAFREESEGTTACLRNGTRPALRRRRHPALEGRNEGRRQIGQRRPHI